MFTTNHPEKVSPKSCQPQGQGEEEDECDEEDEEDEGRKTVRQVRQ